MRGSSRALYTDGEDWLGCVECRNKGLTVSLSCNFAHKRCKCVKKSVCLLHMQMLVGGRIAPPPLMSVARGAVRAGAPPRREPNWGLIHRGKL